MGCLVCRRRRWRRSLISAARCAIASRWSSGVAPGLPKERLSDGKGGIGREAVPQSAVLREGGPLREGEREVEVFKVPGEGAAEVHLLSTRDARFVHPREHQPLGEAALRHASDVPTQSSVRLAT